MTLFSRNRDRAERDEPPVLRCSFCNKSQRDVRKLIAGPMVWICDECVDICFNIIQEEKEKPGSLQQGKQNRAGESWPMIPYLLCALCRIPSPLEHSSLIPQRGVLCAECVEAVREVAARALSTDDSPTPDEPSGGSEQL